MADSPRPGLRTGLSARSEREPSYLFSVLPASCRQNGTMRHATVCRQDAGSTFGVTFRPPLNTYKLPHSIRWRVLY